jgi:hypothetical protein
MAMHPLSGCTRILISISARYQNRVRSLSFRLRTEIGYRYPNRVRSNSSYLSILLPTIWQVSAGTHGAGIRSQQIVRAPDAASAAPATGSLPGSVGRS